MKDAILDLRVGDEIFGVRLSFGGHSLLEPKELNGKVDVTDYCVVQDVNLRGDSDDFRINISYPSESIGFGIETTLLKEIYMTEYCMLYMNTFNTGYDQFYTLKPKIWKDDFKRLYQQKLKQENENFQHRLKIFDCKFDMFLNNHKV